MAGERGEAKQINKQIKAKGLGKLKYFCQACQKQCRDENGFKNHTDSPSHIRQMEVIGQNAGMFIDNYSREFDEKFSDLLGFRYKGRKILANTAYREYIQDKMHLHMNATKWETLSGYCYWLQEQGRATLENGPLGLYITYTGAGTAADAFKHLAATAGKIKQLDSAAEDELQRRRIEQLATGHGSSKKNETNHSNGNDVIPEDRSAIETVITSAVVALPAAPRPSIFGNCYPFACSHAVSLAFIETANSRWR